MESVGAWRDRLEQTVLAPVVNTSRWYYLWVAFLLAVLGWGLYAYSVQLRDGLIVTGMRDRISWGLYITTFVFFIGISHAGTLPYCVQACPNNAIYYGDLEEDIATNGDAIVSASRLLAQNQAYRLKEDLKTKPRVYYIAGHGEAIGRDVFTEGRQPTEWPWIERVKGAREWNR